ncbi:MAG: DeoR/GlpR family DNA-binding transcription regulator [Granulosicoccus sp.]
MNKQTLTNNTHRELEILDQLRLSGGSCRIKFLAERIGVTEQTVRRNIRVLESNGRVRKVHGGVQLIEAQNEAPFQTRMNVRPEAKKEVAASVADMISDGDSLFLDIGSTTAYVAMALQNHHELLIITNSVAVAHTLVSRNNNRVFFSGGELRSHDGGSFGEGAIDFIHQFNMQYAILSVGAIDSERGFMLHDMQEAKVSREAMARAQTTVIAGDSGKFGRRAPICIAEPEEFDILISDKRPSPAIADMLQRNDIDLVLSGAQQKSRSSNNYASLNSG